MEERKQYEGSELSLGEERRRELGDALAGAAEASMARTWRSLHLQERRIGMEFLKQL